ncbi:transaldolase [Oceanivirga salmonicida]|uniref:transaldolase n=1 Tax=Oceanivirga salmonicida TaxID=1769291 RepID=UPI0012E145E3|nr:transaldolase [Oceanivirga salmonicida]
MSIKIYADGAVLNDMLELYKTFPFIKGFTTNPSLMKKAGVTNYKEFAKNVLNEIKDLPLSFEVFTDNLEEMKKEAEIISSWGENVYVKIPITNSKGEYTSEVIEYLTSKGVKVNVTAILSLRQVEIAVESVKKGTPAIISVFAGRISDSGRDATYYMKESKKICSKKENVELLWASPREAYNIVQADEIGVDIITVTKELIIKYSKFGKDLEVISQETVQMFVDDAKKLGYKIKE